MKAQSKIFTLALAGLTLCLSGTGVFAATSEGLDPTIVDRVPLITEVIERGPQQVVSYAHVLSGATPAVVSVHTARVVQVVRGGTDPRQEFFNRFFGIPSPQPRDGEGPVVEERVRPEGIGSGVVISPDGFILTNNHVITNRSDGVADEILVRLNDDREFTARVVGRDRRTDIAVLKIEAEGLPYLPIADSNNIEVGDVVFAIGNPMGVGMTVTKGIVSATGRGGLGILGDDSFENFIQTDASINMGNSGGALIDAAGRLIGINTAILSRTGGNIGIGFAIPSTLAHSIFINLVSTGTVRRGFMGVTIADLTDVVAEAMGIANTRGVILQEVEEGLPAAEAGLQRGDVVVEFNARRVRNANEFRIAVAQMMPGTEVPVRIYRNGESMTLAVILGDRDQVSTVQTDVPFVEGVLLSTLTDELRDRFRISENANVQGAVVTQVDPRSPYARTLRLGMVIVEINDQPVTSPAEAARLLRRGANKLYVFDRGRFGFLGLRSA